MCVKVCLERRKSPSRCARKSKERSWFRRHWLSLSSASASGPSLDALQASAIGCCLETQEVSEPSLELLRPPTIWWSETCWGEKRDDEEKVSLLCDSTVGLSLAFKVYINGVNKDF